MAFRFDRKRRMQMYIKRTIEGWIERNARSFPCVTIYGPRQVGKSTTAEKLFGDRFRQVNLDNISDRSLAIQNPASFLDLYGWPLIIDEVQKAPVLFDEIKARIDQQRKTWDRNGQEPELMYVLTGSSRFELTKLVSESLAGRTGFVEMGYLDQCEILGRSENLFSNDIQTLLKRAIKANVPPRTRTQLFNDMKRGFMPDVVKGVSENEAYYPSYIDSYIEKDIKTIIKPENEIRFRDFMKIMAFRTGQRIVYKDIGNLLGMDANTIKSWISVLVSSGMAILLQPFMCHVNRRIIKAPKFYFLDTGLAASLCGWPSGAMMESGAMSGAFFETYCVAEIVKNLRNFGKRIEDCLFYYRDIDQKEIDLLYVEEGKIFPMEIKKSSRPNRPTKNWDVLDKYGLPILPGLVIDTTDVIRPINDVAYAFPAHWIGI